MATFMNRVKSASDCIKGEFCYITSRQLVTLVRKEICFSVFQCVFIQSYTRLSLHAYHLQCTSEALTGIGKTPAELHPVDLKVGVTDLTDLSDSFWIEEARALRSFFDKRLGQFSSGRTRHVSVFGFAPMPLLVLFGRLLSDLNDVEVFSRLREPKPSWKWLDEPSKLSPELKEGVSPAGRVALKICITDRISDERVIQSVGDHDLSIWEISCAKPGYDVLRTREDLSLFRMVVRNAFNRIKEVHGEAVDVLVFPAAPAACCIEFGRVWQPKTHRPMRIFDQQKDKGFVDCLRIE